MPFFNVYRDDEKKIHLQNLKQSCLVLGIFLHLSWKMDGVLGTSPLVAKGQLSHCLICRQKWYVN